MRKGLQQGLFLDSLLEELVWYWKLGESYPMSQRGDPLGKNLEEIQACHWSDSKNTGFLLAETAGFLKIQKNIMSNLYNMYMYIY